MAITCVFYCKITKRIANICQKYKLINVLYVFYTMLTLIFAYRLFAFSILNCYGKSLPKEIAFYSFFFVNV